MEIDKALLKSLTTDLWMLGEKCRFLGYGFIPDKHRERGQYTLKELVETGSFKYLKSSTEEFADHADGSKLPEWKNLVYSFIELEDYFLNVSKQINELMQIVDDKKEYLNYQTSTPNRTSKKY
jgi:hypothetical protein